jgi:hypothetical protein
MHLGAQPPPRIVVRDADSGAADGGVHEHLQSQYEALGEDSFVCVGDVIPTDMQDGFLRCDTPQAYGYGAPPHALNGHAAVPCRGHGTQVVAGQLMATVCGRVERVNKLVSVRPLRSRCATARATATGGLRPHAAHVAAKLCHSAGTLQSSGTWLWAASQTCGPPSRPPAPLPADASRARLQKRSRSSSAAGAPRGSVCLVRGLPKRALRRHGVRAEGPCQTPGARAAGRRQALGGRPERAAGGHAAAVLRQPARRRAGARPAPALAGRARVSRGRGAVPFCFVHRPLCFVHRRPALLIDY